MRIHVDGHTRGDERTVTVMLRGTDDDFLDLVDQGSGMSGTLGVLAAKINASVGLVDERSDPRADAARLLRRAAELLEAER